MGEYKERDTPESSDQQHRLKLSVRQWLEGHFGWSWFTCTQSTGGIAIVLYECPKQFDGLKTIGVIIFIFNIALWLFFTGLQLSRFFTTPSTFRRSFTDAPECFFFGSFWLSLATVIMSMNYYGVPHTGPWLVVAIRVCFWIYAACTLLSTTAQFVVIFKHTQITAIKMSPAWLIMVMQTMLTGTVAAAIAKDQPPAQRLPIIVAGVAYQGFGWIATVMILAWLLGSLMEVGWPPASNAPSLFMPMGNTGYTIIALIGAARALPKDYAYTAAHPTAPEVLLIVATWTSIFLWIFGLWIFGLALFICLGSILSRKDHSWKLNMTFNNTWWTLIFPNVGFTIATIYLGQELQSNAILWVSTIMVVLLVAFWLLNLCLMSKAAVISFLVDSRVKVA